MTEPSTYQLQIALPELKACLSDLKPLLRSAKKFRAAEVSMEFDGMYLTMTCPGYATTFNASGEWPGRASFSFNLLLGLIQVPPTNKVITIRCDTKKIWIDTRAIACKWQAAMIEDGEKFFSLPQPEDHLHTLQMLAKFSKDALYAQGYQRHLKNAKAWRTARIIRALETLSEFGVTYDELAHFVDQVIASNAK